MTRRSNRTDEGRDPRGLNLLESTQSVRVWRPMAVYGIGSTPRYVTTQEANWGAARPLLPYTNTRDTSQRSLTTHVLGKVTVAALGQALIQNQT